MFSLIHSTVYRVSNKHQSVALPIMAVAYSMQSRGPMASAGGRQRLDRKSLQRIDKNRNKLEAIRTAYDSNLSQIFTSSSVFNAALLQLPIRMGRPIKPEVLPPRAAGNIELLKIPNFFHLTPQKVRRDTDALTDLCTQWPEKLNNRPIRLYSRNYLYAGPSVAHPKSHTVKLEVNYDYYCCGQHTCSTVLHSMKK